MSMLFDLNKLNILGIKKNNSNGPSPGSEIAASSMPAMVQAPPSSNDIKFFDEAPPSSITVTTLIDKTAANSNISPHSTNRIHDSAIILTPLLAKSDSLVQTKPKVKKKVRFPEDDKIIKDYSEAPKRGWLPGSYPTSDLLESYLKSCERHKCKPLARLLPHLKALQDLDCTNGEKVNVLNIKTERLDSKQMEALEEVFKRLSFKTIDLEGAFFDDETTAATLFDILDYYDTCEKLILANAKTINLYGWQSLAKFIRKSVCLELLDLRGHTFPEFIYFTYIARSMRLTTCLRVIHLENSNIQGRLLLMLAAALKDNEQIKEVYLGDNKIQPSDAHSIATIIKENKCLEVLDLRNNSLNDSGLSHICRGLCEQENQNRGLRALVIANNYITAAGISFLSKALIHNRSITTLNISSNALTNQALFELKESLIVNKQISCLILMKVKLTDEGVVALAEYLAETQSLRRLDLRENDIRLGGLMALASSLKFNKTLVRLDLDQKEPKRDYYIKDSVETTKRLIQDIHEYCMRNKRLQNQQEAELQEQARLQEIERKKNELENEKRLVELINEINSQLIPNPGESSTDTDDNCDVIEHTSTEHEEQVVCVEKPNSVIGNEARPVEEEVLGLIVDEEDELLKKILSRHPHDNLSSPVNDELISNYFNIVDQAEDSLNINSRQPSEDYQLIEDVKDEAVSPVPADAAANQTETDVFIIASYLVDMVTRKVQSDIEATLGQVTISEESFIIEDESPLTASTQIVSSEQRNDSNDMNEGANSFLEEDSDIEVLAVSKKSVEPVVTKSSGQLLTEMPSEGLSLIQEPNQDEEIFNEKVSGTPNEGITASEVDPVDSDSPIKPPHFASQLTNSQLSEELSSELGL